jgi:tetratricopeptide (TPR) repeat protein
MRVIRFCLPMVGLVVAASGCATVAAPPVAVVPEMHVVAEPVGPDALEVYDAETLFKRGLDLLDGGAYVDAADYFARLVREFPDDPHALLGHYNLGLCYINLERGNEALASFDAYLAALPSTAMDKDRLDGRFKRGQALAVARRYDEVVAHFDGMLTEALSPDDRIEALVDAGVGHYMLGLAPGGEDMHRPTAEYRFLEARRILKKEAETRRMSHMQFFQAQAAFYLAELAHLDFLAMQMVWPDEATIAAKKVSDPTTTLEGLLGSQLEEKCQRLLRAQYAYLRTIREGHPGWASAAGYNVGKMYEELHESMISLPTPSDLTAEQGQIYRELVRTKVFILLEKAEKTWSQTAEMVTRTGADSEWGVKTRESLARIRARIADEGSALAAADDDAPPVPGRPSTPLATAPPAATTTTTTTTTTNVKGDS